MNVVSLFAGIGGFDLGFDKAGAKTVATVEIDANCRKLLAAKWPDAVHIDDVRTAGSHNLPKCDVVTFGFPCQDLSVAGKRAGLEGKRSGLFYEAMRIVDELKPTWAIWENVPGLLSSDNGRDLARVLFRLGQSGYFGCVRCLDAQWLGVAQRRRRLFGVFTRLDSGAERCAEILSLEKSLRGHPAPSRESRQNVAACFETGPGGGKFTGIAPTIDCGARNGPIRNQTGCVVLVPQVTGTMGERANSGGGFSTDFEAAGGLIPDVSRTISCNNARGGIPSNDGLDGALIPEIAGTLTACGVKSGGWSNSADHAAAGYMVPVVAGSLSARDGNGFDRGDMHHLRKLVPSVAGTLAAGAHPGSYNGQDAHNDMLVPVAFDMTHGDDPARLTGDRTNTLQSRMGTGVNEVPCLASGMSVRRLTPTECERLQGFPDGWTAGFADSVRYKMLGNAVCVNVAEWIARRLIAATDKETAK